MEGSISYLNQGTSVANDASYFDNDMDRFNILYENTVFRSIYCIQLKLS